MNKILFYKTHIEVQCDRNDIETQKLLGAFYPCYCNRIRTLYRLSVHAAPELLHTLRGLTAENIHTAPESIQNFYFAELQRRCKTEDLLTNGATKLGYVNDFLTLEPHQQLARELASYNDKYALFYDTRTGKTPISIAIMYDDIMQHPEHKWLVVCPLILVYNAWLADTTSFVPMLNVINCHDISKTKRIKALESTGNIYVINTEAFVSYKDYLSKHHFTGCILDESSDMKSHKSKVSNELVDFAFGLDRFYPLSGTPAPNGEWEYYMQMRAVDFYGWQSSYTQFKEYYFINTSFNPQYEKLKVKPDKYDELMRNVKNTAIFLDKEDALQTPGRAFYTVDLELPKDLKEHYTRMKNDMFVELKEEKKISVTSAGAKYNKLNQISSGFILDTKAAKENKFYGTDNVDWQLLSMYRFTALKELLDTPKFVGQQVIIWANYRKEFELIVETLGKNVCRCVHGGTNILEKNEAIKLFKEGKIQYLIANPASADKGLTLTVAHLSIYFSLNCSYELFKQSADRIYGSVKIQPDFCEYYVMLAKGTIDAVIYNDVLQGKQEVSYALLNHLKPEVAFK